MDAGRKQGQDPPKRPGSGGNIVACRHPWEWSPHHHRPRRLRRKVRAVRDVDWSRGRERALRWEGRSETKTDRCASPALRHGQSTAQRSSTRLQPPLGYTADSTLNLSDERRVTETDRSPHPLPRYPLIRAGQRVTRASTTKRPSRSWVLSLCTPSARRDRSLFLNRLRTSS